MNNKAYLLISGIIAWITVAYLFKWKIPYINKLYPVFDKITKTKGSTFVFGMAASVLMGGYYIGGQWVLNPLLRLKQEVTNLFGTLTFKDIN